MLFSKTSRAFLSLGLGLALTSSQPSFASGTGELTPAKIRQIRKTNKSFKDCQKAALDEQKGGRSPAAESRFRTALESCRERFPGAGLYIECKRRAVRTTTTGRDTETSAAGHKEKLGECRKYLTAAAFDPDASLPFFVEGGQLYFAGIGLNRTSANAALDPPNFDCERLKNAMQDPGKTQHLLFGNDPRAFDGLRELTPDDLGQLLGVTVERKTKAAGAKGKGKKGDGKRPRPEMRGQNTTGLGRLYGELGRGGLVYLPLAPCDFDGEPGPRYSGLSSWYLIDNAAQTATPLFGIAYFTGDAKLTTAELTAELREQLGADGFRTTRKNRQVQFVSNHPLERFDPEGDPRDLCAPPRPHRFVGVIQTVAGKPDLPEYVLLANTKNLCEFGDRLARRLLK